MITKIFPISTRKVISYAMKRSIPFEFGGRSMETEATTCLEFSNERKTIVVQRYGSDSHTQGSKYESQPLE